MDAHTVVFHRLARLSSRHPHLLPPEAAQAWDSRLPVDTRYISPEVFTNAIPERVDVILANRLMMATRLPRAHKGNTCPDQSAPLRPARSIQHLNEAQPGGIDFISDITEIRPSSPHVVSLLGRGYLIDASKCGSGAYRNPQVCPKLMPYSELNEPRAHLPAPQRPVETAIEAAWLAIWITYPSPLPQSGKHAAPDSEGAVLKEPSHDCVPAQILYISESVEDPRVKECSTKATAPPPQRRKSGKPL